MTSINVINFRKDMLYISSIPELKQDIIEGMKEPIEDYVDEEKVEW